MGGHYCKTKTRIYSTIDIRFFFPTCATATDESFYIDPIGILSMLTKAVQELSAIVTALEAQVANKKATK